MSTSPASLTPDLTPEQRSKLYALEERIHTGLKTFWQVGSALLAIHAEQLHRETHATFHAYCRERWQFSAERARLLMRAAQAVLDLDAGDPSPEHEAQVRPLTQLEPEDRAAVWKEAVALAPDGRPTAQRVAELTAKALASLSGDQQKRIVDEQERKALAKAPRVQGGDGRKDRLDRIGYLTRKLEKLVAGLGPECEDALTHLEAFRQAVAAIDPNG